MKIVINSCYGGFSLSQEASDMYWDRKGLVREDKYVARDIIRHDSDLVYVVETLDQLSCGKYAQLKIVEIPDDVEYTIYENGGAESIHEVHRVWS